MSQSMRTDFPPELERQVVDGGVRDGRPEAGDSMGLLWVLAFILGLAIVVGLAVNWGRFFP